jgi:hypothetical protein
MHAKPTLNTKYMQWRERMTEYMIVRKKKKIRRYKTFFFGNLKRTPRRKRWKTEGKEEAGINSGASSTADSGTGGRAGRSWTRREPKLGSWPLSAASSSSRKERTKPAFGLGDSMALLGEYERTANMGKHRKTKLFKIPAGKMEKKKKEKDVN